MDTERVDHYWAYFWRYKAGAVHNHAAVCQKACCHDSEWVDELETLPADTILQKAGAVFSDWTMRNSDASFFFAKDGQGAFQLITAPQAAAVEFRDMSYDDANALIDIFLDLGCPMYDPGISTRFDSWTDR